MFDLLQRQMSFIIADQEMQAGQGLRPTLIGADRSQAIAVPVCVAVTAPGF
jgi:hypothetical protein